MNKRYLFYAMRSEKTCFQHVLLNALQLAESGAEVRIIFEGESVRLPSVLEKDRHPLYLKACERGLIVGICKACSQMLGVLEDNRALNLALLDDMSGHAGMKPYLDDGYSVLVM